MLLPSVVSPAGGASHQFLTSYLVNGRFAIDAGSLGFYGDLDAQRRIKHVLISHSHLDHIASLPVFLGNSRGSEGDPVTVHGNQAVLDSLCRDVFNNRLWPNLLALSTPSAPLVKLSLLEPGVPVEVEGVRVTPVLMNHVVPTCGFLLEEKGRTVAIASDTGPTEEIWQRAAAAPDLRAVFLEATYPNAMLPLATLAKHLTPALFAAEAAKLGRQVPIIAVHIKTLLYQQVLSDLKALEMPSLLIGEPGRVYSF